MFKIYQSSILIFRQNDQSNMSIDEQSSLSNSTLRRRLFEEMVEDSVDEGKDVSRIQVEDDSNDEPAQNANDHLMSSPIKNSFFSPPQQQIPLTPISKANRFHEKDVSKNATEI